MEKNRVDRVLAALKERGLSQMLIVDPMSICYLTGVYIAPMERFYALYLREDGRHIYFLNKLFTLDRETEVEKVWYSDTDCVTDLLLNYIDPETPLGVDKDLKAGILLPLMHAGAAKEYVNASAAVDETRGIKDLSEQEKMREASRINDAAMARFKALIVEGVTEKQVADQMLKIYQELGAEAFSFDPIVSFGANAADPHHRPDDTVVKEGDCVLFDVGCIRDRYCSDMTRTFYYKRVNDREREIYDTVRRANEAAIAKIKEGAALCELDLTARRVIEEQGYGEYFTHRLGHFIGMGEHEYGDVSQASTKQAKAGMIFSIEPGIYLPGDTGVRVEDLVLVTQEGCEVLNHYTKDLEIIE